MLIHVMRPIGRLILDVRAINRHHTQGILSDHPAPKHEHEALAWSQLVQQLPASLPDQGKTLPLLSTGQSVSAFVACRVR